MNVYTDMQQHMIQNPSTWLLTGVAGFIGSNLLQTLLQLKQKVIGLDNLSTGNLSNLGEVAKKFPHLFATNFQFVEGDICSVEVCEQVTSGVDYILHHAAVASVPVSIQFPEHANEVNVTGFLNILNAAKKSGVKRLVYASSSAVYGDSPVARKNESVDAKPLSPYAVSKYTNELYAQSFNTCFGLQSIGLRYFNIFGPKQNPKGAYAAVIPLWVEAILREQSLDVFGDGTNLRDFCYIDNVVQANILAALTTNPHAVNKVYNIGCGEGITLNQLINYLEQIIEPSHLQVNYQGFRKGDIKISSADISSAKKNLEFSPAITTYEGLIHTIDYYKKRTNDLQSSLHSPWLAEIP